MLVQINFIFLSFIYSFILFCCLIFILGYQRSMYLKILIHILPNNSIIWNLFLYLILMNYRGLHDKKIFFSLSLPQKDWVISNICSLCQVQLSHFVSLFHNSIMLQDEWIFFHLSTSIWDVFHTLLLFLIFLLILYP